MKQLSTITTATLFCLGLGACSGSDDYTATADDGDSTVAAGDSAGPAEDGVNGEPAECTDDTEGCDVAGPVADTEGAGTEGADGTVVSAVPAACNASTDCPEGIECLLTGEGPGYCDVAEQDLAPVSLGAALPCATNSDCPEGIECIANEDGDGSCGVQDQVVEEPGTVSLGAPAMCFTTSDCPEGIECVNNADGPGFCDVSEVLAL